MDSSSGHFVRVQVHIGFTTMVRKRQSVVNNTDEPTKSVAVSKKTSNAKNKAPVVKAKEDKVKLTAASAEEKVLKVVNGKASVKRKAPQDVSKDVKKAKHVGLAPVESSGVDEGATLITWGTGEMGQLGLGPDVLEKKRPARVTAGTKYTHVALGGLHTVAVNLQGKLVSMGCNDEGVLGRHTEEEEEAFLPQPIVASSLPAGMKVASVACGDSHSAVLTTQGKIFYWGNFRGIDGAMGLKKVGVTESVPTELPLPKLSGGSSEADRHIISMACGNAHVAFVTASGVALTVGAYDGGQLGRIPDRQCSDPGHRIIEKALTPQEVRFSKRRHFDACFATAFGTFFREKNSGKLFACGNNKVGQLGLALDKSTSRDSTGWRIPFGMESPKLNQLLKPVSAGQGNAYTVGSKDFCGVETDEATIVEPVHLNPLFAGIWKDGIVTDVAANEIVSFAVVKSREKDSGGSEDKFALFSWGYQTLLQLARNTEEDCVEPEEVNLGSIVPLRVFAGGQHAALLGKETLADKQ
ncbi:unnamed protein product [Notodromas monacha]|uniref:RCC1-like domain-containing protein n=1 Tax=Notodromas monacha TaxID=399045 RepID=A0A7R9BZ10_9CRUS|nr:unnamed protein product [Notodromas monacha]CAG0923442.1 unnamed protein product [Notodromas monacha]